MNFRSETIRTSDGVCIEVATLTHAGKDYAAYGAIIDTARGMIAGYVSADPASPVGLAYTAANPQASRYRLTTWEGKTIAPLTLVRKYEQRVFGGMKTTMYAWSCVINGKRYSGRNSGPAMFVRMRAKV